MGVTYDLVPTLKSRMRRRRAEVDIFVFLQMVLFVKTEQK